MLKLRNLENILTKTFNLKRSARLLTFLTLFGISPPYLKAQDWNITTVDGYGTGPTSISLDSQSRPHIAYLRPIEAGDKILQYAFLSPQGWEKISLEEEAGRLGIYGGFPDIDLDSNDRPRIVYYNENDDSIWEVYLNPYSAWTTTRIDSSVTSDVRFNAYPKITIDEDDTTHVTFIDDSNVLDPTLKYVSSYGDDWRPETIDHLGWGSANKNDLTLDNRDYPHIVSYYSGEPYQGIEYATRIDSDWMILPFITGGISLLADISIACDFNNTPYISHRSDEDDLLCSYLAEPGSWPGWVVDSESDTTRIGFAYYSSIATNSNDSNGQPNIAYNEGWTQDEQMDILNYASYNGQRWNTEVVDPTAGRHPSLAMSNNQPHISYSYYKFTPTEGGDWELRYATRTPTGLEDKITPIPKPFSLSQNYPNPFNPSTTISYSIPQEYSDDVDVSLNVYNLRGQQVKTLEDSIREPGSYSVTWNGIDDNNNKVSSGIYLYTLTLDDEKTTTKKMVLVK